MLFVSDAQRCREIRPRPPRPVRGAFEIDFNININTKIDIRIVINININVYIYIYMYILNIYNHSIYDIKNCVIYDIIV